MGYTTRMYDFTRCKLCTKYSASPAYRLRGTTVYTCRVCGFHYIDHLDVIPPDAGEDHASTLDAASWNFIEARLVTNQKQHQAHVRLLSRHCTVAGAPNPRYRRWRRGIPEHCAGVRELRSSALNHRSIFREYCRRKFGIALRGKPLIMKCGGSRSFVRRRNDVGCSRTCQFPAETLQHAWGLLKPGGLLFLDTPCRDSVFYRAGELLYRLSSGSNAFILQSMYSSRPFRHKQIFHRRCCFSTCSRLALPLSTPLRRCITCATRSLSDAASR